MTSLGEQTWFRSEGRTLEGWVHRPDAGRAVGAMVIAGPFAHEALVTYRALRVLAVEAAKRGFVAVRFSWSGTGDSEPAPVNADLSRAWQEDLAAAVELARAASGLESVDAIGVRFGASVVAAANFPLRTRVLWEPLGGRAFLRMQSSLLTMHLPVGFPRSPHGVELCGYALDEDAAASLRTLSDPRSADFRDPTRGTQLVLDDDSKTVAELFGREPYYARVPLPSIERALDALDRTPAVALPEWNPERELISVDPASGRRIRQTLLALGSDRLPGIFTEPVDGPSASVAALCVPFSNDPKGVDRIARATSFRLARGGIPSLRADRNGIGDAANPRALTETTAFVEAHYADVAQFAAWLANRTGKEIVGIGLCSGAWLIARAATLVPFKRLIMVNNQAWSTSPRYYERQERILSGMTDIAENPDSNFSEAQAPASGRLRQRLRHFVRQHAPYVIRYRLFSLLDRDEVGESLLKPVPEQTSISLLFGTDDQRHWDSARGRDSLSRLRRRGRRIDVRYDPRADHGLMSKAAFQSYLEFLDREFDLRVPSGAKSADEAIAATIPNASDAAKD